MKKLIKRSTTILMAVVLFVTMLATSGVQQVYAAPKVKSIKVTNLKTKSITLNKGKSKTLKIKVTTTGKKVSKAFTVKSNNAKVVKAVKSGTKVKLTAKKSGTAKITIQSKANKKKKINLTVKVKTPVTQVKLNKTSATLTEGSSVTLSATVMPTDADNKKVTWVTSNSKVATVSSTGVVKAVKEGSATITAKAADGSNKSATCKIVVKKAPNKIASVKVYLGNVIKVDLARAQELTKENFKTMIKSADAVAYLKELDVIEVITLDNKTYTIIPQEERMFTVQDDIKISITGLEGTSGAVEKVINGVDNSAKKEKYDNHIIKYNETNTTSVRFDTEMLGCYTYTYDKIPKGAIIKKNGTELIIKFIPNYYEDTVSTFICKDDLGNEAKIKVVYGVYDETHIYSYRNDIEAITSSVYSLNTSVSKYGGSGSYRFELISAPESLCINSKGNIYGDLLPGKYQITYKVSDANDSSISDTKTFNVNIRDAKTISGKVTDAKGRNICEYYIEAINNAPYFDESQYYETYSNSETGCYSMDVDPGTYTLLVVCPNYQGFVYDVNAEKDVEGLNIKLPVYLVQVDLNGYTVSTNWVDKDGREYWYSDMLYLQKGKYELTNTAIDSTGKEVEIKVSMNVTDDMTVKPIEIVK